MDAVGAGATLKIRKKLAEKIVEHPEEAGAMNTSLKNLLADTI
jgi:hypothetical protein